MNDESPTRDVFETTTVTVSVNVGKEGHDPPYENGSHVFIVPDTNLIVYRDLDPGLGSIDDHKRLAIDTHGKTCGGIVMAREWFIDQRQLKFQLTQTHAIKRIANGDIAVAWPRLSLHYLVMFHKGPFWVHYCFIDTKLSTHSAAR